MDVSRYLSVLGMFIFSVFDKLLFKYWIELVAVLIRGLVRFVQVEKSMEHLHLKNKYFTFLGIR